MKYLTRPIVSNILLALETILLFFVTLTFISKITILNKNYVIRKINKTKYYETTYNEIKDTMLYITRKTGLKGNIIEDSFTIETVKEDTNKFIKKLYKGETTNVNTELIKENINRKLDTYEEEKNKKIDDKIKNEYIDKITSTYANEITLMNIFENESIELNRIVDSSNTLLILFTFDLLILMIINKKIFRKKEYIVIISTTILSLLITYISLRLANINNLFIYNDNVSSVLKTIINKSANTIIIFVILYLIIGIFSIKLKKKRRFY